MKMRMSALRVSEKKTADEWTGWQTFVLLNTSQNKCLRGNTFWLSNVKNLYKASKISNVQ